MSKVAQDRFVAELANAMDGYIPAMTPAEFMTVFTFMTVQVMLRSQADLSREKLIDDVTVLVGAIFDEHVLDLTETQGEPN